ncbi:MAG TPA: NADP-dependent malic enzyme [Stellaceae bacterium]|nr:NADP-dependent malic enzyme [Stellaceae bacterium]
MPTPSELLARAQKPTQESLRLHPFYRGKVQLMPKCPICGPEDWSVWYTPGVAAPCKAIVAHPERVYDYTNKGNVIAVVSDGTRVLGLGDIGPEAGLPVMEGKALLFKYLGGVDAVPLCIRTKDEDEIVQVVKALEPSFGGINLEDLAQPKCFRVLDRLRTELRIPVWHDDQQGTATVVLAALLNALKVVGKDIRDVKIALVGMGAANVAVYGLLKKAGITTRNVIACDTKGTLHAGRSDILHMQGMYREKWKVCLDTNADAVIGGIAEAMRGADVCIAFSQSGPGVIEPGWVRTMARNAIVFACANPVPEIWPWEALEAGARIVATGRSDFPNQVNNSLVFPGIFRGVLDVGARSITDEMAMAAARELAACAETLGVRDDFILTPMADERVAARVAAATGMMAQRQGLARVSMTEQEAYQRALATIRSAQAAAQILCREGIIPPPPQL